MTITAQRLRRTCQVLVLSLMIVTPILAWCDIAVVIGNTWSAQFFGVGLLDPLAGAESLMSGSALGGKLALVVAIPVLLTIALGRVFCTWVCPAGFFFEVSGGCARRAFPSLRRDATLWRGHKYVLLVVGLLGSSVLALPILGQVYPPAVVARELHGVVTAAVVAGGGEWFRASIMALTGGTLFLIGIAALEALFSRRGWCRYLCPGGALYAVLGALRPVRVRRQAAACTHCGNCTAVCGMGLDPMRDRMGIECDNCLACVTSCHDDALELVASASRTRTRSVE